MKNAPEGRPTGAAHDIGWRQFPGFEKILTSEPPPAILSKVEKTCRQLNDVILGGSEEDKAKAQLAMTAYGRSLDLLRVLTEMRDKSAEQK
jgi:hypothetical protein